MMNWKLDTVEKKTSVANYLVLHRFGTVRQPGLTVTTVLMVYFRNLYEVVRVFTIGSVYNNHCHV